MQNKNHTEKNITILIFSETYLCFVIRRYGNIGGSSLYKTKEINKKDFSTGVNKVDFLSIMLTQSAISKKEITIKRGKNQGLFKFLTL